MAITKPMLPPKAGYVEVEVDGVRRYRNVETGELFGEETIPTAADRLATLEAENKTLTAKLAAAIESNSMLEECIVEMAGVVYA